MNTFLPLRAIKAARLLSLLCICLFFSLSSFGQEKSNKGTEFWLGFMAHVEGTNAGMKLYITSDSNTSGVVSVPGQNWSANFSVTANNLTVVTIPSSVAYISCSDCIQAKGVKVTSAKEVIVYAHHYEGNKSDATLVLPTRTQGKKYYTMAYKQNSLGNDGRSEFIIVASKDNTIVNITPSVDLKNNTGGTLTAGNTYTVTLDEGEVYQAQGRYGTSTYDITGSYIEVIDTGATANCRTVAVFSGSSYSQIGGCSSGWGVNSGDNLVEQMYPITSWGKQFAIIPALGRSSDNFRFLAAEDGTQVIIYKSGGAPDIFYLDAGEYEELFDVDISRGVNATKPIMVAQFQKTSKCDGGGNTIGDPSMTILNPLEQNLKNITLYSSEYYDIDNHYINVVMPTYATGSFRLDGSSVTFNTIPNFTAFSYARVSVSKGNHNLNATTGFVATAYGEGAYESYGYAAGANVKDFTTTIKVANSPLNTESSGCLGTPTIFQGDAANEVVSWEWDFGDGNTDNVKNTTHTYQDTGRYIAKLYAYKPQFDGCSIYDSATLEVNIYPVPRAILYTESLCEDRSALFRDSSKVDAPGTYATTKWNVDNSAFIYGRQTKKTFDSAGTYQFRMITVTEHLCTDTITDSITISPLPKPKFLAKNTCYFDSTYIVNQSSILTGNIDQYIWDFNDGDSSINVDPAHYYQDSGYHIIDLVAISDSGCSDAIRDTIYKYPRFEVSFTYQDTCFGLQSEFKNTSYIEGSEYTDTTWYTSENDTFSSFNLAKTFADPGVFAVQLIMEQNEYCRDTFEQEIEIHDLANPNFSIDHLCLNDSAIFVDITTYNGSSYNRSWDFGGGIAYSDSIVKHLYKTSGSKTIKLTTITEDQCETAVSKTINLGEPVIVSINADNTCKDVLQTISSSLDADLDSFTSYVWSLDGTLASTDSSFSYSSGLEGMKILSLIAKTRNGCELTSIDSFEIQRSPVADFSASPVCSSKELLPTNLSSIALPGVLASYKWYVNSGFVSSAKDPIISPQSAGQLDLRLLAVSANGCRDSITKPVTIYTDPDADFTFKTLCLGNLTEFMDNSTLPLGGASSFTWTLDGVTKLGANVTNTFLDAQDYSVKLVVLSNSGCSDSITKTVTINPLPELDISLADYVGCRPFKVKVINNSMIKSGTIDNYVWKWGNGATSNGPQTSYTYNNIGNFNIAVVATSNFGCQDSVSLGTAVTVHESPIADFSYLPDEINAIVTDVVFQDQSSADVVDWKWNLAGQEFYSSSFNHSFADSGNYPVQLVVTNDNGCSDTTIKLVTVNSALYVHMPTAFSPNADNNNDEFGLFGITSGVTDLKFYIYNRWGELIFYSEHPDDRWDGTYKGQPCRDGVYIYTGQYTDPKFYKYYYIKGTVTLLR